MAGDMEQPPIQVAPIDSETFRRKNQKTHRAKRAAPALSLER